MDNLWKDWLWSLRVDPFEHLITWTVGFLTAVVCCSLVAIFVAL